MSKRGEEHGVHELRRSGLPPRVNDHAGPTPDALDALFTLSPALLCIAGTDGFFKRVNPAFHKTLGHTEAALLSRPFIEFVHPDDRRAALNEVGKLSSGIPTVNFENRYRHANGSYRWLLWNTTSVAEEGLLYATAIDITERKRSDEMFRELLNAAPDAILLTEEQGRILRINHAAELLFGYPSTALVGQSIEVLVPVGSRDQHREHRRVHANDPRPRLMGGGLDLFAVHQDGSEFPVEISLGPVQTGQGRLVICTVRDDTLRRQRERELQERGRQLVEHQRDLKALTTKLVLAEERERRRIAIGLHDDVGQALAAAKIVLGELQERGSPGDGDLLAREAQCLVDHAIKATRALTFELASAALYEVGLEAALLSACERAEQETGIRFLVSSRSPIDPLPEATRIVFYRAGRELIRNVMKHSKATTARLALSRGEARIRLAVADDGLGFEASADLSGTDPKAGIGLLSIAQQLDQIGGKLEITSPPGGGARVEIAAPVDPEENGT